MGFFPYSNDICQFEILPTAFSEQTTKYNVQLYFYISAYRKRRKFRGVIDFMVFMDATIPWNLILGQEFTQMAGTRINYNAERSANSRQSRILP